MLFCLLYVISFSKNNQCDAEKTQKTVEQTVETELKKPEEAKKRRAGAEDSILKITVSDAAQEKWRCSSVVRRVATVYFWKRRHWCKQPGRCASGEGSACQVAQQH